ncbi:MAG: hypothetical protein ACRDQ4_01925 [Pseudonocardiaceae bacterium]
MTEPANTQEPEQKPVPATLEDNPDENEPPEEEHHADAASVLRGIAAAVANPGTTAAKHNRRRQGRKSLGVDRFATKIDFRAEAELDGDIVTGEKHVHYTQLVATQHGSGGHYEFDAQEKDEIRAIFVAPDDFGNLITFAKQRSVVIVRVPAGFGKRVTGFRLLDSVAASSVFSLNPSASLQWLTKDAISEGAGYLLVGLSQTQANELNRHDLERLDAELKQLDSRLVIAVANEIHFADNGMVDYLTEIRSQPQPEAIVEKHLRWRLTTSPGLAETILARPDVVTLITDELGHDPSPRKAARLAHFLAEGAEHPASLVETVLARLSRQAGRDLGDWFQGLPDLHSRSFVAALAVLNGLPNETVAEAARSLYRKLSTVPRGAVETTPGQPVDHFASSRSARLTKLRARLTTTTVQTQHGPIPADVVQFVEAAYPSLVLRHMWQEYDDIQPALMTWLRELGGHPSEEVRIRSGVAVGALTNLAFDFLRSSVLVPWARSEDSRRREVAAVALDAANARPELRTAVRNLVQEWGGDENPELVATAVRAYGSSVGTDQPDDVFEAFDRLAESEDFTIVEAVCASLAELVETGIEEVATKALTTTHSWATSRIQLRRVAGNLAFLLMAADLVWSPDALAAVNNGGRSGRWPMLLRLADSEPRHHDVIAGMWTTALSTSEVTEVAQQVLDGWALIVEDHEPARLALAAMLRATASTARARNRVHRHVETWARADTEVRAPKTAAAVLATFVERNDRR